MRTRCSFEGCGKPSHARGYCNTHYARLRHTGTVANYRDALLTPEDWFMRFVEFECNSGCWLWSGAALPVTEKQLGYGLFRPAGGQMVRAHRYSYELFVGAIPAGLLACHHCDTPLCVNPAHLFAGTHHDNNEDCRAKGRMCSGERRPDAKLTEADVVALRVAWTDGRRQQDIADAFGVSRATARNIWLRKKWAHVP
jgi:hypothetical protein